MYVVATLMIVIILISARKYKFRCEFCRLMEIPKSRINLSGTTEKCVIIVTSP